MITKKILNSAVAIAIAAGTLTACSKSDGSIGSTNPVIPSEATGGYFISATSANGSYLLATPTLDNGSLTIKGDGVELFSSYTWVFHNSDRAFGLLYQQGDPGLGVSYKLNTNGKLEKSGGDVEIVDRFTSYGPFGNYVVSSVGGYIDSLTHPGQKDTLAVFNFYDVENGNANTRKTIATSNFVGNTQQATFSGIVDLGDGTFLTSAVLSGSKAAGSGGGSSSGTINFPDSCWVIRFDANLNVKNIYRDGRISYSSGRYRSQYYSQMADDDNGNTYVFSGAYESTTTKKAGVIRINKGATAFDQSFYMDIQSAASNHKFKRVWHISDGYFLLEFYNQAGNITNTLQGSTAYGIVNTSDQSFKWLDVASGMPDSTTITGTGLPTALNSKIYLPVTVENMKPAVYIIDPAKNTATRGLEVDAVGIGAVGYLNKD